MADSAWIINTTDQTFEADVYARSETELVVVDFWADWCAPCRALAPVLEKLANDAEGKFTLVKADTAENEQAAGEFGVRGIPAVYAVLDRQIIDGFSGALPEQQLTGWLDRLYPAVDVIAAKKLAEDDPKAAEEKLRSVIQADADNAFASITLGELLADQDRVEEAQAIIDQLEARGFLEPGAEQLKATLLLKQKGTNTDIQAVRDAATANPDDFGAQLSLAEALVGSQQYQDAFDICLSLVENDRQATGEKARELMVQVFQALPTDSELVNDYRRKLSMLLY